MRFTKIDGARLGIGAAVVAAAMLVYADAGGSTPVAVGAAERRAAEAEIAQARTVTRLEAAMGDAFGGVWFEPSTGQLHVGVPSAVGRHAAEAASARAGVTELVAETPVRSTWEELQAAQRRWADRLADLFDRAEVATSLRAQHNALEVQLGSSVSASRLSAVRQAAAGESVEVLIEIAPSDRLRVVEQKQCNAFVSGKAACDAPIVAGVTISNPNKCTAGPAVIPKDASTGAKATERLILSAGHCIATGGTWSAYNKKGDLLEIGQGSSYLSSHVADVGAIKINTTSKWLQAGFIPVKPAIALWSGAESEPIPVVSDQPPVENYETCISGQTSGTLCGKIVATGKTFSNKSNMAEVNVVTQTGDSGAPWYSRSYAESGFGLVEGTHVGRSPSPANTAIFQPLAIGLEKLKEKTGLDVELLTQNNQERRHPVFTAKKYPATLSASDATSEDEFTAFGATVKCTENKYHGDAIETAAIAEVTPTYGKCTGPLGVPVVAVNNGCKYAYTLNEESGAGSFKAEVDIVCPEGKPGIQFRIYASHTSLTAGTIMCTLTVPPQFGLGTVTMANSGENILIQKGTIEGVRVLIHRNSFACPSSGTENETASGVYHNDAATVSGASGAEAVKIDIGAE